MPHYKRARYLSFIGLLASVIMLFSKLPFASTVFANPPLQLDCPAGEGHYDYPQCTWWASQKRPDIPHFVGPSGEATNWADSATKCGFPVDTTPQPGDIAVFPYDHVAYVESVNTSDGSLVVSECNSPIGSRQCPRTPFRTIQKTEIGLRFIHYLPGFKEEFELRQSQQIQPLVPWQIKYHVTSKGKFQLRLDDRLILEGTGSNETDWQWISPESHTVQLWVQRFQDGQFYYEYKFIPPVSSAESSTVPPKVITPTPTLTPPLSKPVILSAPSLSSPSDGSSLSQGTDVRLSWNTSPGASQYKVEVWGGPYGVMPSCDWQGGTSCSIGKMFPGTMSWHVRARNADGQESAWSDTWSFTIGQAEIITITPTTSSGQPDTPPKQFNLISPFGYQKFRDGSLPNLQWKATTDPDGDPVRYQVVIYNANSPDARLPGERDHFPSDWLTGTSWQPVDQGLEVGGRYTWYVNADDGHGHQTTSIDRGSFEIVPHRTSSSPCPAGVGPGPTVYKAGDYDPNKITQQEKNWLWKAFGHDGDTAPDGYGGERCGEPAPVVVVPSPSTNTPTTASVPSNTPTRIPSLTPTNAAVPPTYTPTFTPIPTPTLRPCPAGKGPGPTVYKAGDYDPNKITQAEKNWLWKVFGHDGDTAPDGYGGERCQ
jgi:surface antigen